MNMDLTCPACDSEFSVEHTIGMDAVEYPKCSESASMEDVANARTSVSPLAVVVAVLAGLIGSIAWAALSVQANLEIGYLAWGIGAFGWNG